jgi:two-component system, NtrC family, sensor kinase
MKSSSEFKLKERVKELNCLYAISKAAWEANNDVHVIIGKTLEVLPNAMQHPGIAEVSITIQGKTFSTPQFAKSKYFLESPLATGHQKHGHVKVGYRTPKGIAKRPTFLPEERTLIKAVARELSLFLKRAMVEQENEKLQSQLQHIERLAFVGELSAGIAHELNEPLGRILGFAQLIKKASNLNPQQSEDIERIIKASLYAREIIKKLMIFSRQMPRQVTKININEIVENILYFIDVRFQSRGIKIVKQLDHNLPDIEADEVQMSQVLVNLITNAVHAMPGGGEIHIVTRGKVNSVNLIVRDNGVGMQPEVKEKIFEPFFTTKPVGQGTGLGLSVVQGIIDSHQGKIAVTSALNKGSKFEITLPLTQSK